MRGSVLKCTPRHWRFVPRATQAPNATIPRIGRADSRPQFADGTRQSPRRSAEAEILSQGMQPSMRGPDLEPFRHHPSLGLGTDRSQSMRQMADLSHTPSTNCCQRAEGRNRDGAPRKWAAAPDRPPKGAEIPSAPLDRAVAEFQMNLSHGAPASWSAPDL